jgi:hypothetical protein
VAVTVGVGAGFQFVVVAGGEVGRGLGEMLAGCFLGVGGVVTVELVVPSSEKEDEAGVVGGRSTGGGGGTSTCALT